MTTIAAVHKDGHIVMSAESMTNVYDRPVLTARKICRVTAGTSDVLIGTCGDGAMASLIRAHLTIAGQPKDNEDPNQWAATVAAAITEIAADASVTDGGRLDGSLILAARSGLWTVVHQQAIRHDDGIAAIGSGEGPAMGAIAAMLHLGVSPLKAVPEAVTIACRYDKHSGGTIHTETL